ncbi:MAG TPA: rod shape-determining protein [Candidatus Paceibacterota bacterium]|nr:rod shape-determining protein [Candidatus Paceibacterota bacterium]
MKKRQNKWKLLFSNDIGIDLGTVNTLVYLGGRGIVLNEPSVVAINQKTGRVVAVGKEAKEMLGRTPAHLKAVCPLVSGVISDYEVSEEMLSYFLRQVKKISKRIRRPRVVVGVPSGITNVESRAVRDAARAAGAREVHIIEEPLAAAIGVELPVNDPVGNMVIDMGGGTTDLAVISLGGVVISRNVKIAGDKLNEDIISYVRNKFQILIGERTAEAVKIAAGSMLEEETSVEIPVRGRDLVSGLPREVMVTDEDIKKAVAPSLEKLLEAVKEILEETPPEILSDILKRGIVFVGGGALIRGLREAFEEELQIPIHTVSDPLSCVARGTGLVLENFSLYKDALIKDDDAFEPST